MTSTTPEHDAARCHAAAEDRRQLLCRLRCLAERLEECDRAALQAAGCGELLGPRVEHPVGPAITYPEYPPKPHYKLRMPEKSPPWAVPRTKSTQLIAGYVKTGCDCVRRNGLQDQCELTQCQGRPLCLTTPVPLCPPSGGGRLQVTPSEAAAIVDYVDRDCCYRPDCCAGLLDNC